MNYNKQSVLDISVAGKKVLLRGDFNVPLDKATGKILDNTRLSASLPTIRFLLDKGAAVILCSHLGRPGGKWNAALSMAPVGARLSQLMNRNVLMATDVVGPDAMEKASHLQPGELLLLENLRFHPEEEANDPEFSRKLASMADVYVSDAFGTCHRAHASTAGVADHLPAVSGLLLKKELEVLGGALEHPKRPFVAVLGGAKVTDKIGVLDHLLDRADAILIGGGMAFTFLFAAGGRVGNSLFDAEHVAYARSVLAAAKAKGVRLMLPVDVLAADHFGPDAEPHLVPAMEIPAELMGLDIGPDTRVEFSHVIQSAGTVIWNGPMGVFEFPTYSNGTRSVAEAMALSSGITIVGGGDSAAAVDQFGYEHQITHISTGGGASLEFLEGKELPGVACLLDK